MHASSLSKALRTITLAFLFGLLATQPAAAEFELAAPGASLSGSDGQFSRQAGAHADVITQFGIGRTDITTSMHKATVDLPPGIIGNARIAPTCPFSKIILEGTVLSDCPVDSAVGLAEIGLIAAPYPLKKLIYNVARPGDAPALFAFNYFGLAVRIEPRVRATDYGVSVESVGISQALPPTSVKVKFWGVPADASHDLERSPQYETGEEDLITPVPSPARRAAFLSNPTSCPEGPAAFRISIDSWADPGTFLSETLDHDPEGTPFTFTGCDRVPFEPAALVKQHSRTPDTPTGLDVDLTVPQSDSPDGLATAHVRKTAITFPEGMSVAPGSAAGQGACTEAEIAIGSNAAPACPDSSRIGTVQITTPLLDETLEGSLYLAEPHQNPLGSLLATYLAVEGPGFFLKLPGKVEADPESGRLTATFDDQPQLPYESVSVSLRDGPGAPLTTPASCGTYETKIEMTSWASPVPVNLSSPMTIDQGCETGGFAPQLRAGTSNPVAGAYSPFQLQLSRRDGEQNLGRIETTLPPGLLAKLAGVPLCSDPAAISGDCPAASQLGSATVEVGAGPTPLFVPEAGKEPTAVYLAGPYRGAPYSLVVRVPAQAGPFDLGTVAVRSAIAIDPVTAQVSVASDPLPQILEGIPLAYRELRVAIDRPEFTLNPTSCSEKRIASQITSAAGQVATPSARFGVAGCGELGFKPNLKLALKGKVNRRAHPSLRATLTARPGDANIARAQVKLPKAAFLDNAHIGGVCTRVQFAADQCPADSIYGYASATTPLLDYDLKGNVYLRSSNNKLPDLVVGFNGPSTQPIEVELAGKTDSVKGALRNTFEAVPDVPVSTFDLTLFGGKRGLIIMSSGFCSDPRASFRFTGQNGAEHDTTPKVPAKCPKAKKGRASARSH